MFITKFTLPVASLLILGALTYGVGLVLCPALVAGPPGPQQRDAAPADVGKERIEKIKAGKALPVADMSGDRINVLLAGIKAGDKMGELVKGQAWRRQKPNWMRAGRNSSQAEAPWT